MSYTHATVRNHRAAHCISYGALLAESYHQQMIIDHLSTKLKSDVTLEQTQSSSFSTHQCDFDQQQSSLVSCYRASPSTHGAECQ